MMLEEYHLLFIIITFILLLYSIELLFRENTPRSTIAAMIVCGINSMLCVINYLSFFGIGIIGYIADGTIEVNTYADMYNMFMFFFGMYWINMVFIFYGWYKFAYHIFIDEQKKKKPNV